MENSKHQLLYSLDDSPPFPRLLAYAVQWLLFAVGPIFSTALVLGPVLELSPAQTVAFLQRLLVVSGVASLAQATIGHKLPAIEASAVFCWGYIIPLAERARAIGLPVQKLMAQIQGGLILAGIVIAGAALLGLGPRIARLFTPTVRGVVLMMAVLQVCQPLVNSMTRGSDGRFHPLLAGVSSVVVFVVFSLSLCSNRLAKSLSLLTGLVTGWAISIVCGLSAPLPSVVKAEPLFFSWGLPSLEPYTAAMLVLGYFVFLPNTIVSMAVVESAIGLDRSDMGLWAKGIMVNGLAQSLSGMMGGVGTVSWPASAAIIRMTGVAARLPYLLGCVFLAALGLLKPLISAVATIPVGVASAGAFAAMCNMFSLALQEVCATPITSRRAIVIGFSVLSGLGIGRFSVIVAAISCILLEQLLDRHEEPEA
ncbi:MAG: purine/pyrimidine permease [Bacillota bacterium]